MKNKTWKFILGFAVVLVLSIAFFLILDGRGDNGYYEEQMRIAQEIEKEYEEKYKNDTYGGDTPEETLELFIEALKAGDTDLASKYFVLDKQEEWRENLKKVKDGGKLDLMTEDLSRSQGPHGLDDHSVFFDVANSEKEVVAILNLVSNPFTNKWKIESL